MLYFFAMAMKLISNKVLREFAQVHADAEQPLQDFRHLVEKGTYTNFAQLKATFASVDKVGERWCSTLVATSTDWWPLLLFRSAWCGSKPC